SPGHSVEVEGFIPEDCKVFAINLGTDGKNFVLHFNPRFDHLGVKGMLILNSKVDNVWGQEQRESFFPFQEGLGMSSIYKPTSMLCVIGQLCGK
ncbi:unnamed protein product, partial [Staurois parvus]